MHSNQSFNLPPICVDLDGTLIRGDLLITSSCLLLKKNILYIGALTVWLLKGKAHLKAEIARRIHLEPQKLVYNENLINWLKEKQRLGHTLWLCTATNYRLAERVSEYLKIFSGVIASSDIHNLSGLNKAEALTHRFGEHAFIYCGNHRVDLSIWRVSKGAVVVGNSVKLRMQAALVAPVEAVFSWGDCNASPKV